MSLPHQADGIGGDQGGSQGRAGRLRHQQSVLGTEIQTAGDAEQAAHDEGAFALLLSPEMFLAVYVAVAFLCLRGSLAASTLKFEGQQDSSGKRRLACWDFLKLLLCFHVVLFHCSRYLFYPEDRSPFHRAYIDLCRPYMMPCFIFVSGILGSNLRLSALSSTLSYMWLNLLLLVAMFGLTELGLVSHATTPGLWYLWCLPLWRCFSVLLAMLLPSRQQVKGLTDRCASLALLFLALHTMCYTAFHLWSGHGEVIALFFFYLPTYLAGAWVPRQEWEQLFANAWMRLLGLLYISAWYICILSWRWLRDWYQVACIVDGNCIIEANHFPDAVFSDSSRYAPVTVDNFVRDLAMATVRVGLVVAVVSCVLSLFNILSVCLPHIADSLAEHGSRTLPVYVLHMLLLEASQYFDVRQLIHALREDHRSIACLVLAIQATIVLSSRGADAFVSCFLQPALLQRRISAALLTLDQRRLLQAASDKPCI
mmetsp:Transcript_36637/g.84270  ORF Transcript_36637/g.84270 Transcript_36637/m.84270 type:complete len:482 (+) Transcript_36637:180-1625(+)